MEKLRPMAGQTIKETNEKCKASSQLHLRMVGTAGGLV